MEKFGSLIMIAVICGLTIVLALFGGCLQPRENFFDEEIESAGAGEDPPMHHGGDVPDASARPHTPAEVAAQEAHAAARKEAASAGQAPANEPAKPPLKEATVRSAKVVRGSRAAAPRKPPVLSRKTPEPPSAPAPAPADEIEGFSGDMYAAV
jgi:hypothetical protein